MIARVLAMVKRGSLFWLRKKCQVLRTRRPTGLDHATLTAPSPNVKNGNSRHGGPRPRRAVINQERVEGHAALVAVVRREHFAQALDGTGGLTVAQGCERRARVL